VPDQFIYHLRLDWVSTLKYFLSGSFVRTADILDGNCTFIDAQLYSEHMAPEKWSKIGCQPWWLKSL
jgi:hypothetical protein